MGVHAILAAGVIAVGGAFGVTQTSTLAVTGVDVCPVGYYENSGWCIPDTGQSSSQSGTPTGATAQCCDSTYSSSQYHRGTCDGHGGVCRWLS